VRRGDFVIVVTAGNYRKPRPALIVQRDLFSALPSVVICPLTTTLRTDADNSDWDVSPSASNGLQEFSQLTIDTLTVAQGSKFGQVIGIADDALLLRVSRALALFLESRDSAAPSRARKRLDHEDAQRVGAIAAEGPDLPIAEAAVEPDGFVRLHPRLEIHPPHAFRRGAALHRLDDRTTDPLPPRCLGDEHPLHFRGAIGLKDVAAKAHDPPCDPRHEETNALGEKGGNRPSVAALGGIERGGPFIGQRQERCDPWLSRRISFNDQSLHSCLTPAICRYVQDKSANPATLTLG
jgi:mRNA interferase MazF